MATFPIANPLFSRASKKLSNFAELMVWAMDGLLNARNKMKIDLFIQHEYTQQILIPAWRGRPGQYIIITDTLLFRYIFGELAKIPGNSQYTTTPDRGNNIFAVKVAVP